MFRKLAIIALATPLLIATVTPAFAAGELVITFESNDTSYLHVDFDDKPMVQASSVETGTGSDTSQVLKVIRGKASWAGTTIVSDAAKPVIKDGFLTVTGKINSPKAGVNLMMKVENRADNTQSVETFATESSVVGWHTYTWNFANQRTGTGAFNKAFTYNMASVFFDFVTGPTASTTGQTYYLDDVTFASATSGGGNGGAGAGGGNTGGGNTGGGTGNGTYTAPATLLTFETGDSTGALDAALATPEHPQGVFGGGSAAIADAPAGGSGGKALALTKAGAAWTGLNAVVDQTSSVRFTTAGHPLVSFNYYSPKANSPVAVQLFQGSNMIQMLKTANQGWNTMSFDFSTSGDWSATTIYDKVVLFPDFLVNVSTPADVYYFDNVAVNGSVTPAGGSTKPANAVPATLSSAAPKVGAKITLTKGTFTGTAPVTYKYTWYRCSAMSATPTAIAPVGNAKCVVIAGQSAASYKAVAADKGKYIRAMVTATNSAGSAISTTKSSAKVG